MALSQKSLQSKREKKKKKRCIKIEKYKPSPVVDYSSWPIHECWVSADLWEDGIGNLLVSRMNHFEIVIGVYLIDVFCLGIKNSFLRVGNNDDYQYLVDKFQAATESGLELVEPVYAATLVQKSAEYAKQFGFMPHPDFAKASKVLKNIPVDSALEFTFGKAGLPYYVQGPSESHAQAQRILSNLDHSQGPGNYNFLMRLPGSTSMAHFSNVDWDKVEFVDDDDDGDDDGDFEDEEPEEIKEKIE